MTRDEIIQALASAASLNEQIKLVAELDALDHGARKTASAERSIDWADTTVRQTLAPRRTLDRHTASSDWLAETDTSGDNHHQAVIAEASVWYQRLDGDVKADAHEFTEQARGVARRTAGKYGEAADEAADAFLSYVAFLNREVLAASGVPQVQQLVDAQENPAQTPLPTDVFDTFQPPVHPINQGIDGNQTNSLAPGAQEAVSGGGGGGGMPSHHDEGQAPVSEPYNMPPSARQGSAKHAGMLERAKHQAAQRGHAMQWKKVPGPDAWAGQCAGCGSSIGVTATAIVEGSTAHTHACNNRSTASLAGGPSVAIGYTMNMNDFLRMEAENKGQDLSGWAEAPGPTGEPEASAQNAGPDADYVDWTEDVHKRAAKDGGAAPFVREGASGLDQVQQTVDSQENPKPTSLPEDVMFPIDQPWPEEDAGTGQPSRHESVRKQADTWQGGNAPAAVPGGQTPVGNTPATTPEHSNSGNYQKGMTQGRQDAAAGEAPSFADKSSGTSDFVRGYVEGYGPGPQSGGTRDVPVSMGGDNGQAQNAAEIAARTEKPLTMAKMTVSASLIAKDVTTDSDFQRGYGWARRWKEGEDLVALGSKGEEAGIYAGITDNPAAQGDWVMAHWAMASAHPELTERLHTHRRVTASLAKRDESTVVKGLYVQAATSLDLDTMSPVTSPDPQGATPSEGPGTVPILRDAPGTPAAPGGAAPYNGAEPFGAPVVPDPMIQDLNAEPGRPQSPDAVNISGDSSLLSKSPQTMAFRKLVQANKLALRQTKEN